MTTTESGTVNREKTVEWAAFVAFTKAEAARLGLRYRGSESELKYGPRGFYLGFEVDHDGVWGSSASVTLSTVEAALKSEDGLDLFELRDADIAWSSTGRNVAHAIAAVANYQRAIEFAARVEAFMDGRYLVVTENK